VTKTAKGFKILKRITWPKTRPFRGNVYHYRWDLL